MCGQAKHTQEGSPKVEGRKGGREERKWEAGGAGGRDGTNPNLSVEGRAQLTSLRKSSSVHAAISRPVECLFFISQPAFRMVFKSRKNY